MERGPGGGNNIRKETEGFSGGSVVESTSQYRRHGVNP